MKKLIDWFNKPLTTKFKFVGWLIITTIFIVWFCWLTSGCKSFEKQVGGKPNTDWRIKL